MSVYGKADRTIADAMRIKEVMKGNPDFKMKDASAETMESELTALNGCLQQIDLLDLQMSPLRRQRDDLLERLAGVCARARAGFKSYFGPDSLQYQQAGGTRASDRKRPQRRPSDEDAEPAEPAAAAAGRN